MPRRHASALCGALAGALLCAALGGCAGSIDSIYSTGLWVQPGKYDFIKCPDIAQRLAGAKAQEKNLMNLMARADQEVAGPVVNVMVYQAQLEQARGDIRLLEQTYREKNCHEPPPPPKAAPAPPARRPAARR